jgi:uncharacterized phage protein (TIGR01671 family)
MRPIKFRAWDLDKKEMFNVGTYDFLNEVAAPLIAFNDYHYHTILMQFTGLLDKNGKEIYEGDIAELGTLPTKEEPKQEVNVAEVRFSKGQFWCSHYGFPVYSWACNDKCFIEVIGNIYENSNLFDNNSVK